MVEAGNAIEQDKNMNTMAHRHRSQCEHVLQVKVSVAVTVSESLSQFGSDRE